MPSVPETEPQHITSTSLDDNQGDTASKIALAQATSSRTLTETKLRYFKLWETLRSGDPSALVPLLASYPTVQTPATSTDRLSQSVERTSVGQQQAIIQDALTGETQRRGMMQTPLHLAAKCAKYNIVDLVLKHRKADLNVQDPATGQTPLHIAASLGRLDVVALLLAQPDVDDSLVDRGGHSCLDVARGAEVSDAIAASRQAFNNLYLTHLASYIRLPASTSPSSYEDTPLYSLLLRPRARVIDFAAKDRETGTTLLHEAVKRQDVNTLRLAISKGADVLVRDRKGKKAVDLVRKEDRGSAVRNLLRRSGNDGEVVKAVKEGQTAAAVASSSASLYSVDSRAGGGGGVSTTSPSLPTAGGAALPPPTIICKGYLKKWTNVGRGYQTRYFVLQNGTLSYYRSKEDEGKATKGSISMKVAKLVLPQDDKTGNRFEIAQVGDGKYPKLYMKADHQIEAMRWKTSLNQAIRLAQPELDNSVTSPSIGTVAGLTRASTGTPNNDASQSYAPSLAPSASGDSTRRRSRDDVAGLADDEGHSVIADDDTFNGDGTDDSRTGVGAPHEGHIELMANSLRTHIELTQQLVDALVVGGPNGSNGSRANLSASGEIPPSPIVDPSTSPPSAAASRPPSVRSLQLQTSGISALSTAAVAGGSTRQADVKEALRHSLREMLNMTNEYFGQVDDRERYFKRQYEREIEAKRLWEENMREAAAAQAELEMELKRVTRDNSRRKKALKTVRQSVLDGLLDAPPPGGMGSGGLQPPGGDGRSRTGSVSTEQLTAHVNRRLSVGAASSIDGVPPPSLGSLGPDNDLITPTPSRLRSGSVTSPRAPVIVEALEEANTDAEDSDDNDEFFEAIDEGILPIQVDQAIAAPDAKRDVPKAVEDKIAATQKGYEPYKQFRDKLPITSDDRPTVSLWGFLKSSIGKDLTKISLPVSFNECTSMLQRMAEDMEFSECLDAAAANADPSKRIAYVAAFAMSNYSSTLGRIAKPFNPMLGETFEYARMDKMYRYMSEQVSHHPPMSACICEAPRWRYYGEVDAKSKFTGKTFEIRPTGVAHATLLIPKDHLPPGANYPPSPARPEMYEEHYSWKKVISSVSNLILGTPQIDHYGDMEITNHRTGHKCVLTFKPRGWRAKDAFEIAGYVNEPNGARSWDIAGRWNSQLVARRAGNSGALGPDDMPVASRGDYFLLWRNSEKPEKTAFNLTPFAITLNDTPTELKPWLPPTDCRLRPDQHAFEHGQFEKANTLKTELEEFQRATRRARERGDKPPHKPRWFTRKIDPDTNERVWEPSRLDGGELEYWEERNRVGELRSALPPTEWKTNEQAQWREVEHIYPDTV